MPEPTLALTYPKYKQSVGAFLGHGRGSDFGDRAWTRQELGIIEDCLESGQRLFYEPVDMQGGRGFCWSFLRPVTALALASGENTIALPADFGQVEGPVTILSASGDYNCRITLVGEGMVRKALSESPTQTGRPEYVAVVPLKQTGNTLVKGQRFELAVYPLADEAYTLQLSFKINPNAMSDENPYPYGGASHAETLLEACLSVAERRYNNAPGVHTMAFNERMLASMSADKRLHGDSLGYNRDRSDSMVNYRGRNPDDQTAVTYNGSTWA